MPSARALARLLPVAITRQPKSEILEGDLGDQEAEERARAPRWTKGPIVPEPNIFV